jgi:pyrimidine operon attenuation protein/uracil phosphoribosyltransferase
MREKTHVMDADDLRRALRRIAHEILERHKDPRRLVLVGIRTRGVHLATRLAGLIEGIEQVRPPVGILDVTLYRDDRRAASPGLPGDVGFPVADRHIVLVDDVLYTGRTVRAALDECADFGRPRRILLCVLVDRGGRELPIQADIVGTAATARPADRVDVLVTELDGRDAVELARGA